MGILDKIKKKIGGNNGKDPQEFKLSDNGDKNVMEEIDNTMIDANKRIEKMLEEMGGLR